MTLVAASTVIAPTANAVAPAQAIDALNRQRAAHGIPAGIVENPVWSHGCRQHMTYLRRNDLPLSHHQDASLPSASPQGAEAGEASVLTSGDPFLDPATNPWEDAPIHLMQLLAPALSVTGYADGCMWTWAGYQRAPGAFPQLFSYPGPGAHIYAAQTAREDPFVPGEFVGLPEGTRTGPHIYVLPFAMSAGRIVHAQMEGPDGLIDVRIVDNHTAAVGRLLPPGGILIPVRPLRTGSSYHAAIQFIDDAGLTLTGDWTFRTHRRASMNPRVCVRVGSRVVAVSSRSSAPATLTVRSLPERRIAYRATHRGGLARSLRLPLPVGRYRACVRQRPSELYAGTKTCRATRSGPLAPIRMF